MKNKQKLFAFRLASQEKQGQSKWKAREGVSVAGCTATFFARYHRNADLTSESGADTEV